MHRIDVGALRSTKMEVVSGSIGHQKVHYKAPLPLNHRQLKTMKKLLDAGPRGFMGGMTTKKYQAICQLSIPTAARDLIELERIGLLFRQGAGRSTRYYPAIDGWAEDMHPQPEIEHPGPRKLGTRGQRSRFLRRRRAVYHCPRLTQSPP